MPISQAKSKKVWPGGKTIPEIECKHLKNFHDILGCKVWAPIEKRVMTSDLGNRVVTFGNSCSSKSASYTELPDEN